jgi:hypothetical protein
VVCWQWSKMVTLCVSGYSMDITLRNGRQRIYPVLRAFCEPLEVRGFAVGAAEVTDAPRVVQA